MNEVLLQVEGPDCACVGKEQGPDCACVGKEEKHSLAQKGPDCACVGKEEGLVLKKKDDAHVDAKTAELLDDAKHLDVKDMPMMLTLLRAMYNRFKDNIVEANRLEKTRESQYAKNTAEYDAEMKAGHNRTNLQFMHQYWEKSHALGHDQYRASLKIAHAGT